MPVLECVELGKSYGGGFALEGLTLGLEEGRVLGLLGPNGSGKTTLIKLIAGLIRPERGAVRVCGQRRRDAGPRPWSPTCRSGRTCPTGCACTGCWTILPTSLRTLTAPRRRNTCAAWGLDTRARVRSLSKGERQKARLALAMSRRRKALPARRADRRR